MSNHYSRNNRVSAVSGRSARYGNQTGGPPRLCGRVLAAAVCALAALCLTTSLASAATAAPELLWQSPENNELGMPPAQGSAAGQLNHPESIAADSSTGNVYVVDTENLRVDEFTAWGEFVKAWGWGVADGADELQTCGPGAIPSPTACQKGLEGVGAGQFLDATGITVDSSGDIYVSEKEGCTEGQGLACESQNFRVQKFDPEGKFLLMIGGDVNKTKSTEVGSSQAERNVCTAASGNECGAGKSGTGQSEFSDRYSTGAIATGPSGTVFVGDTGRIQEFEAGGGFKSQILLEGQFATDAVGSLAVGGSGDLYLTLLIPGPSGRLESYVLKLSPTGALLFTFAFDAGKYSGSPETEYPQALTVDAAGDLYVALEKAAFEKGVFSYREIVEFGPDDSSLIPVGSGFAVTEGFVENVPVIFGLASDTVTEAGGVDIYSVDSSFLSTSYVRAYGPAPVKWTPPKHAPEIKSQYAVSVGADGAALGAQINPRFWADTSYYVEYGTGKCGEGGCSERLPVLGGAKLGAGEVGSAVATKPVTLSGLSPGATYHYRFVAASSGGGPSVGAGAEGVEATFTTPVSSVEPNTNCPNQVFRVGASAALSDCRAYEMVSPIDKNNTDIVSLINISSDPATLDQSAFSGEKLAYTTSQGFGDAQGTPYVSQYIASRGPEGWQSDGITPRQGLSRVPVNRRIDIEFRDFTADLCSSVLVSSTVPVLAPGAAEGFFNLYRHQNCGEDVGYETLTTFAPPPNTNPEYYEPDVQGVSADGSCTVFRAEAPLTPEASLGQSAQLYESCGGRLHLLSVLPNGKANTQGSSAGTLNDNVGGFIPRSGTLAGAVSTDGSRIYWTAPGNGAGKLYLRENATQEQSEVSAGECTEPEKACTVAISNRPAHFWSASPDGSKVLYTVEESGRSELYESELEDSSAKSTLIAGKLKGVLGAGEDASDVYFVSEEVLTGVNAQGQSPVVGTPNAYLFDTSRSGADRYRFIGTLSVGDATEHTSGSSAAGDLSPVNFEPVKKTARVSADGLDVVFMSKARLTGYDNTDLQSGEADAEVYLYDASADNGEGLLSCVSCNPTGQRPAGRNVPYEGGPSGTWAAALLPLAETELYAPRVISEDGGRVFFDSYEALVSRDTDGKEDVYEWERPGAGDCSEASPAFNAANDGCVSLISSGESSTDSEFVDASADGHDVFFATAASLVPQDPGLIDIYDARVDGGFPAPPGQHSSCEGEACQSAPSPPKDATPASASFSGPGNLMPVLSVAQKKAATQKKQTPSQVRAKKLAKALKACRSKAKSKRKSCEVAARKRYRVKSKSKAKKSNREVRRS
jgi:NHL repeat